MTSTTSRRIVELKFGDESHVVVTPEDQDRFALSVEDAIEACRAQEKRQQFQRQHDILIRQLSDWLHKHEENVDRAYVTTRDNGLLFLVVTRSIQMNPQLQDDLTELDLAIANDPCLDLIRLSVLAIPNASDSNVESFLS